MIFGGWNNYQGIVYTINLETMKLGTIDNVRYRRASHSDSSFNKHVYFFGGYNGGEYCNDL